MAWYLVKPLVNFRAQLNEIAPNRDKASDGIIGDYAHSQGSSGHNPDDTSQGNAEWDGDADNTQDVRAIDVDRDLRTSGLTAEEIVRHLVQGARSGRFWFIRYIIFDGIIYHKNTGYQARAYTGSNPHDHHFHISSGWSESADDANPDYGLEELLPMALDSTDKAWLSNEIAALTANAGEVWSAEVNPGDGRRALSGVVVDLYNLSRAIRDAQVANTQAIVQAVQAMGNGSSPVDVQALASLLGPQVVAGVLAAMPAMDGATPQEVQERVEAGVRSVLGSLS